MKLDARSADRFIAKPDPKVRGVVIYGNDEGLVAERGAALARAICADLKDPFRVVDLAGEQLKADPARLADEFGAISMMGGRRVVRVRPAGEECVAALENLVAATAGDALIVIEAGSLGPKSGLRTLAETESVLAALPCYMDNEASLRGLVEGAARERGYAVDDEALDWIVARLGGDRGQSRSEIDKLLLYMGEGGDTARRVTLDDATAILGDTADLGVDHAVGATFDGDMALLDRALDRVFDEGGNPVMLVRALQRHAASLHLVAGHVAAGTPVEAALGRIWGLPKGGPQRARFIAQTKIWPLRRLSDALPAILDAERDCMRTGFPKEAIARRLCARLANAAAQARARR